MALIECSGLAVGYGGQRILGGLDFSVNTGDSLCIVGENGSGKTTLMKTLLGLIPPVEGKIVFGDGLRRNEIGYLPQQSAAQRDFPASVREIALSGCANRTGLRPFYNRDEKRAADDNIAKMGLSDLSGRCYRELSGGQQQRVLLARALCATRKLLLLDEPVTGLDPAASDEMYRIVDRLNREDGITVIVISHDVSESLKYATHVLHAGSGVFFGTSEEYRRSGFSARVGKGENA
ncbi:MAG: ABC transporter ATP-binding protein [Clostridia bacterium]|nr:ABC transporter ATP-binding protein [Clostridia bacterium]